jgi:protein SFI1
MGIEIQFDHDGAQNMDQLADGQDEVFEDDEGGGSPRTRTTMNDERMARTKRRRNSESSIWPGNELGHAEKKRPRSFSSHSRHGINASDPQNHVGHGTTRRQSNAADRNQDRPTNGRKSRSSPRVDISHGRIRSTSAHAGLRVQREAQSRPRRIQEPEQLYDGFDTSHTTTESVDLQRYAGSREEPRRSKFPSIPPSATLMDVKAALLYDHHLNLKVRQILNLWQVRAIQLREDNRNLRDVAEYRDRQVLCRQAFDTWRTLFRRRRQEAETKHFFDHLGRRTERARNIYTLNKAFTFWTQHTIFQIQRTAYAQNHILKTRCLNGWREITAVNELKVRRQVLKKFYGAWRSKYAQTVNHHNIAVGIYKGNLVDKLFWKWFWTVCESRAQVWLEQTRKQKCLKLLASAYRKNRTQSYAARNFHNGQLLSNSLNRWVAKSRRSQRLNDDAQHFNAYVARRNAIRKWTRELGLLPAVQQVRQAYSRRLLETTFYVWLHRTRLEMEAAAVDRTKILREALLAWNDQLRCKILSKRIDQRIVRNALYLWVVSERLALAQQLRDRGLKLLSLQRMLGTYEITNRQALQMEEVAEDFRKRNLETLALGTLRSRLDSLYATEAKAQDHLVTRKGHEVLSRWRDGLLHVRHMQDMAQHAEFYLVSKKTIRRWKTASQLSRRERYRKAYSQIRSLIKRRQARDALKTWRGDTQRIQQNTELANGVCYNRSVVFGMEIFDRWRAYAEDLVALSEQAQLRHHERSMHRPLLIWHAQAQAQVFIRRKLLKSHLLLWRLRSGILFDNETQAKNFLDEHTLLLCGQYLTKWSNSAFQIRAQVRTQRRAEELKAEEYRERCSKRHFRKIFRYWRIKVLQKTGADISHVPNVGRISGTPVPRTPGFNAASRISFGSGAESRRVGATSRAEEWTAFEQGFDVEDFKRDLDNDEASTSTPAPGYLRTPSRRTRNARSTSIIVGSTTPRTPISTPFAQKLREGLYSGGNGGVRRSGLRQSIIKADTGFANITEEEGEEEEQQEIDLSERRD